MYTIPSSQPPAQGILPRHTGRSLRERLITVLARLLRWLCSPLTRPPSLDPLRHPAPRLVVLKPCCLGDVLMTTPALAALRAALPQAHIVYATSRYALPAISASALVDGLLDVGLVGTAPRRSWSFVLGYPSLVAALRAGRYDACLVLDRSPLLALLPWLAGVPIRAGIDSAGRGFALNVRAPWSAMVHECDLYSSVVGALALPARGYPLSFTPAPADEAAATALWSALGPPGGLVVAVGPGGGVNPGMTLEAKRWPSAHYARLVRQLVHDAGATVLLVGGPSDAPVAARVIAGLQEQQTDGALPMAALHDLTGGPTFGALGALLRRCHLFVGNDSAPMHLAAAVGCPVVALFGPTNPAMYAPYASHALVVQPPPPAGARSADGSPFAARDLAALDVPPVWQACQRLLGLAGAP